MKMLAPSEESLPAGAPAVPLSLFSTKPASHACFSLPLPDDNSAACPGL